MKAPKLFCDFSRLEWLLWLGGMGGILFSFWLSPAKDLLSTAGSLIGVTALIFLAKGRVAGHVLGFIFSLFYAAVSFFHSYYGEMITYLGMGAPIALMSALEWAKNPYQNTATVKIRPVTKKQVALIFLLCLPVTGILGVLLDLLGTENLVVSTISVITSFFADALCLLRSPYYALAYAVNDVVLIVLWGVELARDSSCLPTLICFVIFLINDLYGFYNWKRMMKQQKSNKQA